MRVKVKQLLLVSGCAAFAGAFTGCSEVPSSHAASNGPEASGIARSEDSRVLLACAGRVEGVSPTVEVGAAADGVISRVYVLEGQQVNTGQHLAEIECGDRRAELRVAQADLESTRQTRARIARGSRDEERQIAAQKTAAARSVLERASTNLDRMRVLHAKDNVSRSTLDDAVREFDVAQAGLREALRFEQMTNAGPLPEELARADAQIAAAESRVRAMQERVSKCVVVSPMNATILQVLARPGESFSTVTPRPLLTLADISRRRVRAEVDERDVMKAHLGQKVQVFTESRPESKYAGAVSEISSIMGRKKVLLTDPADKKDRDVLEAVIDLDRNPPELPVGMRVIVQFLR